MGHKLLDREKKNRFAYLVPMGAVFPVTDRTDGENDFEAGIEGSEPVEQSAPE
jgi:hypothetical protein